MLVLVCFLGFALRAVFGIVLVCTRCVWLGLLNLVICGCVADYVRVGYLCLDVLLGGWLLAVGACWLWWLGGFALVVCACFSCLVVILVLIWFGLWVCRFAADFATLWGWYNIAYLWLDGFVLVGLGCRWVWVGAGFTW